MIYSALWVYNKDLTFRVLDCMFLVVFSYYQIKQTMKSMTQLLLLAYIIMGTFTAGFYASEDNLKAKNIKHIFYILFVFALGGITVAAGLLVRLINIVGSWLNNFTFWHYLHVKKEIYLWKIGKLHFIKNPLAINYLKERKDLLIKENKRKFEVDFLEKYIAECEKRGINESVFD